MLPPELQDLLDRYAHGPSLLRRALDGVDAGTVGRVPPGSDWSIRDVVTHLVDAELVRAVRIRTIIAEDEPPIVPFDEGLWKRRLQYLWRNLEGSVALFDQLCYSTAEILRHAGKDAWARAGKHPDRGILTVRDLVQAGIDHVEEHTAQVRAAREAFQ
ncbi:MAG: DinB family protein [Dehalococcoidia bacterium]|nr:DinB family protein [Dehalococcoidia bacterium]